MHFITLQHFIGEIFGIPENVPRFLKNVFHIPDEQQLGLASLGRKESNHTKNKVHCGMNWYSAIPL